MKNVGSQHNQTKTENGIRRKSWKVLYQEPERRFVEMGKSHNYIEVVEYKSKDGS